MNQSDYKLLLNSILLILVVLSKGYCATEVPSSLPAQTNNQSISSLLKPTIKHHNNNDPALQVNIDKYGKELSYYEKLKRSNEELKIVLENQQLISQLKKYHVSFSGMDNRPSAYYRVLSILHAGKQAFTAQIIDSDDQIKLVHVNSRLTDQLSITSISTQGVFVRNDNTGKIYKLRFI